MQEQQAIADLKAAGMPEDQARVLVRVVREAAAQGSRRSEGVASLCMASQDEVLLFARQGSRRIDAELRFHVACLIGIFAAMYALLRLIL